MSFSMEHIEQFNMRIDKLDHSLKPRFGKMNVNQMVCHCSDFFRMALGIKKALEYGVVEPNKIVMLARSGKTAPAPKGFGQIEGNGTKPTTLENDKNILKKYILEFSKLKSDFIFAEHPYFGNLDSKRWITLAEYHLNHHLKQFGV